MKREFETSGEFDWSDGVGKFAWHSKVTIDRSFVAAVRMYDNNKTGAVEIMIAGTPPFVVAGEYSDVVQWWLSDASAQ